MGQTILEEAMEIVDGQRQTDYGHPRENHRTTAIFWSEYLKRKYPQLIPAEFQMDTRDVGWLNVLQKISRDANNPKRDNIVDTAGWARNIEMAEEVSGEDEP